MYPPAEEDFSLQYFRHMSDCQRYASSPFQHVAHIYTAIGNVHNLLADSVRSLFIDSVQVERVHFIS